MGDQLREQLRGYAGGPEHELIDDDENLLPDLTPAPPTAEEMKQEYAAPGQAARLRAGVLYQGAWRKAADGMARHVRESALALATSLPVRLETLGVDAFEAFLDDEVDPEVLRQVGYLQRTSFTEAFVAVRHVVFTTHDFLREIVCPSGASLKGRPEEGNVQQATVIHTSWERDRVAGTLARQLAQVGQVWVPCRANLEAMVRSGVPESNVFVVPYPYDPTTHLATQIAAPRGSEQAPPDRRFYSIGKWEPRKDQHALLGAFMLAFTPKDRACLTLKTHGWGRWKEYLSPPESMEFWLSQPAVVSRGWTQKHASRLIKIETEYLDEAGIADLHRRNNIYVSSGHGEAWDIPAFDARCAGNALVYVGYGGPSDYTLATGKQFVMVEHEMAPVDPGYKWETDARWAGYSVRQLADALAQVEPPERRWHPEHFPVRFGRHAVGGMMRDLVMRLLATPDAVRWLANSGSYG